MVDSGELGSVEYTYIIIMVEDGIFRRDFQKFLDIELLF